MISIKDKRKYIKNALILLLVIIFCSISSFIYLQQKRTVEYSIPGNNTNVVEIRTGEVFEQNIKIKGFIDKLSLFVANGGENRAITNVGSVEFILQQGTIQESGILNINGIEDWTYVEIPIDLSNFTTGTATLTIKGIDTQIGSSIFLVYQAEDIYELPPLKYNGESLSGALVLKYRTQNFGNGFRDFILFFFLSVLLCLFLARFISLNKNNAAIYEKILSERHKDYISIICIIFITVVYLLHISGSINSFIFDDKAFQWLPVMESALDEFFNSGHLPTYNFFQLKGFDILKPGYYGLYNPLIWVAYLISKIIGSNTISVYIFTSYCIGNIFIFLLGRKFDISRSIILILVLCQTGSIVYFSFIHWYYIINNYWFIPCLLFVFMHVDGSTKEYYAIGTLLAFSILLGNIQYTFYHCIIVFSIYLSLILFYNISYIKKSISNAFVFFILSMMHLYGLYIASKNNMGTYDTANADFFATSFKIVDYIKTTIYGPHKYNILFVLLAIISIIILFYKSDKLKLDYQSIVVLGIGISYLVFLIFLGGREYWLAEFFSKFPLINSFRYLYKILTILPALIILLAMYTIKILSKYSTKIVFVILLFSFILTSSATYGTNIGVLQLNSYEMKQYMQTEQINFNQYRYISLSRYSSDDPSMYHQDTHNGESLVLGNMGTEEQWFGIGGYDNTYYQCSMDAVNTIFDNETFAVKNCIPISTLISAIENYGDLVFEQLCSNSVKYIIYLNETSQEQLNSLIQLLNQYKQKYRIKSFTDTSSVIELQNVKPVISNENGVNMNFVASMDKIEVECDKNISKVYTTLLYNNDIKCKYIYNSGKEITIVPEYDKDFNIVVDVNGLEEGTLIITYHNGLNTLIILMSIIIVLLCFILCVNDNTLHKLCNEMIKRMKSKHKK